MIDWSIVEGFDRDVGNERKSEVKHRVSSSETEQVFFNQPLLVMADLTHSGHESRRHALGVTDGARHLHLTFTSRSAGRLIRIISARDMHRKERGTHAQSR